MDSLFGLATFQVFNSHYRHNIFSSLQKVLFDSVVYSEIHMYILYSYLPMESYIYFCKIKIFYNFLQNTEMKNCSFKGVSLPLSFLSPPIFCTFLVFQGARLSHLFIFHLGHYQEFDFWEGCAQKQGLIPRERDQLRNAGKARGR